MADADPVSSGAGMRARDLWLLVYVPVVWLIARALPRRVWAPVCGWMARTATASARPGRRRALRELRDRFVAAGHTPSPALAVQTSANAHLVNVHLMAALQSRERVPPVALRGAEHIRAALQDGRGVILWVAPTLFGTLHTKVALQRAGFEVSHLSRPTHGFSSSRFGVRFLNPLWTRAEDRFLAERLVMEPAAAPQALSKLTDRVRAGRVVSVTFTGAGMQRIPVTLLGRQHQIPIGMVQLARRCNAALLPVFTLRCETGDIETHVHAALESDGGADVETAARACVDRYAALAEQHLLRHPDQAFAL